MNIMTLFFSLLGLLIYVSVGHWIHTNYVILKAEDFYYKDDKFEADSVSAELPRMLTISLFWPVFITGWNDELQGMWKD